MGHLENTGKEWLDWLDWVNQPIEDPKDLAAYIMNPENDSRDYETARFFIRRARRCGTATQKSLNAILNLSIVRSALVEISPSDPVKITTFEVADRERNYTHPNKHQAFAMSIYEACRIGGT